MKTNGLKNQRWFVTNLFFIFSIWTCTFAPALLREVVSSLAASANFTLNPHESSVFLKTLWIPLNHVVFGVACDSFTAVSFSELTMPSFVSVLQSYWDDNVHN